jgi:protein-disulfide isomerase
VTKKIILISVLSVAVIALSILVVHAWGSPRVKNAPSPASSSSLVSAPTLIIGDPRAKVTLVEYADFQCPFCKRFFEQTEPQIRHTYVDKGLVKIEFHIYPYIGPESIKAGVAAYCANDQQAFTAYHDKLYQAQRQENTGVFTDSALTRLAQQSGLNIGVFTSCYNSGKYQAKVETGIAEARAANATATPTIFIGKIKVVGAQPFMIYRALINAQI